MKPGTFNVFFFFLRCHWLAASSSFFRIYQNVFASFMTFAVIAIVLALPMGLYIILQNMQIVGQRWNGNVSQVSIYLRMDIGSQQIRELMKRIKQVPEVADMRYISPEEGLKDFQKQSGLDNIEELLGKNPLPGVIVVSPNTQSPQAIDNFVRQLQQLPFADSVQLDNRWLQRFYALIDIAENIVYLFALLLLVAVFLVIGNTIRLMTRTQREEIEILTLLGATYPYVRRPFLYAGIWFGALGGCIAWILVSLGIWILQTPIHNLAVLYNSHFQLHSLSSMGLLGMMIIGALIGYLGSWLAVTRELSRLDLANCL